ncbi:MAG: hypothetical protein WCJ45_01760 [bacterium]
MKAKYVIGIIAIMGIVAIGTTSEAYLFGMKSRDNSISNIQQVEKTYNLDLPVVAFIFDPRGDHVEQMMNSFNEKLGADKVYHISISPNSYTAKEVYEGKFDENYTQFFQDVKKNDLKVIFRTMHEMNG